MRIEIVEIEDDGVRIMIDGMFYFWLKPKEELDLDLSAIGYSCD